MVTAAAFVDRVRIPLADGWGYIWGTAGETWTAAKQKRATREQTKKWGARWIGKTVCDCSGLPRWALLGLGISLPHSSSLQHNQCRVSGKLKNGRRTDGKPIRPGTLVFLYDANKNPKKPWHHVGVYVGGGVCIESKGTLYGVVTSHISHWHDWGELKCIDYGEEEGDMPEEVRPTIRIGDQGEDVKEAQEMLIQLGYLGTSPGADGKFGTKTAAAVKTFQSESALRADGVIGPLTWAALVTATTEAGATKYTAVIRGLTVRQATALMMDFPDADIAPE